MTHYGKARIFHLLKLDGKMLVLSLTKIFFTELCFDNGSQNSPQMVQQGLYGFSAVLSLKRFVLLGSLI